MPNPNNPLTVLNELIRVSEDGEQGFNLAAEKASDPTLKGLLVDRAQTCQSAAQELQGIVYRLGGTPEQSGTLGGRLHRGWVRTKTAIGGGDVAVLDEVERGEDIAKAVYARALETELPGEIMTVVDRQYRGVLQNHDRIRTLRDQFRAAR